MGEFLDYFRQKKNLVNLLLLAILILALPLVVQTVRQQQIIKSRAASDAIIFTGADVIQKSDGTWTSKKPLVSLQLTSPLGPPGNVASINLNPPQIIVLVPCLPKETSTGDLVRISWVNPPTPVNKVTIKTGNSSYTTDVSSTDLSITAPVGFRSASNAQLSLSPDAVYAVTLTGDMESGPADFSIPACGGTN
ncbi:MAG: hypothetical protein Q8Q86_03005 [Candidatus Daviesbacteria bacterium]|nr:hypothetical protein [Candidatus Daviesbacteria bacterium]